MMGGSNGTVDGPAATAETAEQRARRLGWRFEAIDEYGAVCHRDDSELVWSAARNTWAHRTKRIRADGVLEIHLEGFYFTLDAALDAIHGSDDANG